MNKKRLIFSIALTAFVVLIGWWCLYFHYDVRKLYSVIPDNAIYISEHKGLGERWKAVAGSPFSLTILNGFGVTAAGADAVIKNPAADKVMRMFAARTTVVAYVPSYGLTAQPAWIFASWAGASSQLLNLGLLDSQLKDFASFRLGRGDRCWILKEKNAATGERFSLAMADGILLGCYSREAAGVEYMLRRLEEKAAPAPAWKDFPANDFTDRGWYRWISRKAEGPREYNLRFMLNIKTNMATEGWMAGSPGMSGLDGSLKESDLVPIKALLGDTPDMFAIAPLSLVKTQLELKLKDRWPAVMSFMNDAGREDGRAFVGLLGDRFSGRVLGIKAPTVVAGFQIKEESNIAARVSVLVEELNAGTKWGLMLPVISEREHVSCMVLSSAKEGVLGDLELKERPALVVTNGWLVMFSNLENMEKFCAGNGFGGEKVTAPRWMVPFKADGATAYAHCDLMTANQTLRNLLALCSIAFTAQGGDGLQEKKRMLNEIRGWVDAGKSFKSVAIWMDGDAAEYRVRFRIEPH